MVDRARRCREVTREELDASQSGTFEDGFAEAQRFHDEQPAISDYLLSMGVQNTHAGAAILYKALADCGLLKGGDGDESST